MSGFLHRLAARALQAAPTVHPAARLPYAPLAADGAPAGPEPAPLSAPAAAVPSHPRPPHPRADDPRLPRSAAAPPDGEPPRASPTHPGPRPLSPEPERAGDAPGTHAPERIFVPLVQRTVFAPPAAREPGPADAHPADAVSLPSLTPGAAEDPGRAAGPDPSPAEPFASAPVLPRGVVERVAAAAREAEGDGPAVVEVHIGRIEIAAPPPPPAAPRRVSAPGRRPMSLSEYLERRRGRGR